MKQRAFSFHYNRPASRAAGRAVLTVHYKNQCLLVNHIQCWCPIETKIRKTQPRCVMQGKCNTVEIYGTAQTAIGALIF